MEAGGAEGIFIAASFYLLFEDSSFSLINVYYVAYKYNKKKKMKTVVFSKYNNKRMPIVSH